MIAKLATAVVIGFAGFIAVVLGLILSDRPKFQPAKGQGGMAFSALMQADYSTMPELQSFAARDGASLDYRLYEKPGSEDRTIILVHGSAWHGMQFHAMAQELAEAGLGRVVVPDMRGHGRNPARRGDVDYIAQLEDDMADLIGHLRGQGRATTVVLGGHSSGGGFVLRFAGGEHGHLADAYLLMAPFLKYNAPTTRENSGGWARPATRRIIGLSILNGFGVTALNHLPAISFAMPDAVMDGPYGDTATTLYTYRMNAAFAAHGDYEADLKAMDVPLLVVAGRADEAFIADRYEDVIAPHVPAAQFRVLDGVTHMGVLTSPAAFEAISEWLAGLG